MLRRPANAVVAFAAFTVVVWGQRIVNIAGGADGSGFDVVRASVFVVVGLAVAVAAVRAATSPRVLERVVRAAAALTAVSWFVQMARIVGADHDAGFVVVHAVLAIVSVGLGVWAWTSTRRDVAPDPEARPAVEARS